MSKLHLQISVPSKNASKKVVFLILTMLVVIGIVLWTMSSIGLFENKTVPDLTNPETPTLTDLKEYALDLINTDRQVNGLQNVSLSAVNCGQTHADDMIANDYFSHWDLDGYKPYMRYTLSGGNGAVDENIAYMRSTGLISDIKETLNQLENKMMYDDASSNWGHRDNILEASHNMVSIGVAFDNNRVYLVQDFEDQYIEWTTLVTSNGTVTMKGTLNQPSAIISQISISYETSEKLTTNQLSTLPYQAGYDSGTTVGSIVPPQWQSNVGITITPQRWNQAGQNFNIEFNMSPAFAQFGPGVYTLYLWTQSNTYLTTYSIWYNG